MSPEEDKTAVANARKLINEIREWDPCASHRFILGVESFMSKRGFITYNQLRAIRKIADRAVPVPWERRDEGIGPGRKVLPPGVHSRYDLMHQRNADGRPISRIIV